MAIDRAAKTELAPQTSSPTHAGRDIGILCGLCLLLLVPFINRPYHGDDPLFVWIAQHIRTHPLDFYGFELNWEDHRKKPVAQFFENPPLTSYVLAGVSLFTGFEPVGLHASFLIFNLLSVAGMYLLARRFCRRPFLATLLLMFCPAFLVSATTVMCEPILICLWIWAILLWVWSSDGNSKLLFFAAVVMLAAVLAKYLALALVPLLLLHSILHPAPRRLRWLQCLALAVPVIGAISYETLTRHLYGGGAFHNALSYSANTHSNLAMVPVGVKILGTLAFVGGCAASAVIMLPLLLYRWVTAGFLLVGTACTYFVAVRFLPPCGWIEQAPGIPLLTHQMTARLMFYGQYVFWVVGGLGLAILASAQLIRSTRNTQWRDELFLCAWMAGIFLFTAFINWAINGRSILPMLPALCIVAVRGLDFDLSARRSGVRLAVSISAALAVAVTAGDYNLAATMQSGADKSIQLAQRLVVSEMNSDSQVWFIGQSGFEYYMDLAGVHQVDMAAIHLKPGDLVVYPDGFYSWLVQGAGFRQMLQFQSDSGSWVTLIEMGSGFYASYGYQLPFVFGPVPRERFDIVEVTPTTKLISKS